MDPLAAELSANANKLIGFSFDLGSINSETYGSASNLKGELLYTLPCEQFRIPKDVQYPAILHKYALEAFPICRGFFTEMLDEEAIAKMEEYVLAMLLVTPPFEMDAEKAKCLTLIGTISLAGDDLVDSGDYDTSLASYKMVTECFNNIIENIGSFSWKLIPNITYEITTFKAAIKSTTKLVNACWPNFRENAANDSGLTSQAQTHLQASLASKIWDITGSNYSMTTTNEMYRFVTGNFGLLRILNLLFGIKIPLNIQQDIIFKTVLNNFADMLQLINAFIGLERDIKFHQIDNPLMFLVAVKNKPLQEAFDECYENYQGAYSDYMINVAKLMEVYGDDGNVCKYLHHMSWFLDGSLTGYQLAKRYKCKDKMKPIYTHTS